MRNLEIQLVFMRSLCVYSVEAKAEGKREDGGCQCGMSGDVKHDEHIWNIMESSI